MSDCSCINTSGDFETCKVYNEKDRKARKPHPCIECKRTIQPGETYKYGSGIFENKPFSHATCADCQSIVDAFFCEGRGFGSMWEYVREHINNVNGEISDKCLNGLTPAAKAKIIKEIDKWLYGV